MTINNSATNTSQTIECTNYNWKDIKYFKITLDTSNWTGESEVIKYNYSVTYFPNGVDNGEIKYDTLALLNAPIYPMNSESGYATAETKDGIVDELIFFIDDNQHLYEAPFTPTNTPMANANDVFAENESAVDYSLQGGYGTYVFTFTCSDKETSGSRMYNIIPTELSTLKDEKLTIYNKTVSSTTSINNAYEFSIPDAFCYIPRNYIRWKIRGSGADGTKYVLLESDKTAENDTPLYTKENAIKNTGISFILDTKIQGTWIAEVIIDDGQLDENGISANLKRATSDEVSTIKPFSTTSIIWIVAGISVVAVGIVATIIIVNIKKEKTW